MKMQTYEIMETFRSYMITISYCNNLCLVKTYRSYILLYQHKIYKKISNILHLKATHPQFGDLLDTAFLCKTNINFITYFFQFGDLLGTAFLLLAFLALTSVGDPFVVSLQQEAALIPP